jgi:hypothetical protein
VHIREGLPAGDSFTRDYKHDDDDDADDQGESFCNDEDIVVNDDEDDDRNYAKAASAHRSRSHRHYRRCQWSWLTEKAWSEQPKLTQMLKRELHEEQEQQERAYRDLQFGQLSKMTLAERGQKRVRLLLLLIKQFVRQTGPTMILLHLRTGSSIYGSGLTPNSLALVAGARGHYVVLGYEYVG